MTQPLKNSEFGAALLNAGHQMPAGVIGPDGAPAPKRFNVYRNNVVVSLTEALAATYPTLQKLLGEEYFSALVREYIGKYPPKSPVLIWYGQELADFVESFPPLATYPYLADVARCEWAWLQAYHAADQVALDPAALAEIAADALADIRFRPHAATYLLTSSWPIYDLLQANRFGACSPEDVDMKAAQSVLITRPDIEVVIKPLRSGGHEFFSALINGETLGLAAGVAMEKCPTFDLSANLSDALESGAFIEIL